MNQAAVLQTVETRPGYLLSRFRASRLVKGELGHSTTAGAAARTAGDVLMLADQIGGACHEGYCS